MAIQVVEFLNGGTKLERFLPNNQHTQWNILNFGNWVNGGGAKMCQNLTFKANFLCQKSAECLPIFS